MTAMNPFIGALLLSLSLCIAPASFGAALPDFSEIVEQRSAAVVKIVVNYSAGSRGGPRMDSQEIPDYLRRFFQIPEGAPAPNRRPSISTGSGFVISPDGYIITNNHVVEGAEGVVVRFSDRSEYDAEIIGTDPRSDLALLRIEGEDLPALELAADEALKVGEWVLAIGSPFGLDYSVTAGIVSAKGRSLPTEQGENYVPFIQTDVAINPGNSGGPLFNLEGQVVGVNSQIYTRSGGSIGLSFAIPVSVVRNVVAQLQDNGRVTRGWLGVSIQDVDRTLAESFGLDKPRGALVANLTDGGPADEAGIEPGDIILSFNGVDIPTSSDLPHVVGLIAPGTRVPVEIQREQKRRKLRVEVGGLDADDSFVLTAGRDDDNRGGLLGLVVETAGEEALADSGVEAGVLVREVIAGSAAAEAGVVPGDIITLLGNRPVRNAENYTDAVTRLRAGQSLPLRLIRRGTPLFIGLKVPQ